MYQTLHEEEALAYALSESLQMYQFTQEEKDLALAISMSLGNESPPPETTDDGESGTQT